MTDSLQTLNFFVALGGIALLLGAAVLAFDLYTNRVFLPFVGRYGVQLAFFLALAGSAMTLVYSEVFGLVPCGLCWLQRVFLYPQVFVLATGMYRKDRTAPLYALVLCVPGILVALYQHYLQLGGTEVIGCPTSGGDCAARYLFEFGFVTFPLVSAGLFLFLLVLCFYALRTRAA
jgi:disulfide bond formation protein DsbB